MQAFNKDSNIRMLLVPSKWIGYPSGQLPGTGIPSGIDRVYMVFLTVLQEGETLLCRRDHV